MQRKSARYLVAGLITVVFISFQNCGQVRQTQTVNTGVNDRRDIRPIGLDSVEGSSSCTRDEAEVIGLAVYNSITHFERVDPLGETMVQFIMQYGRGGFDALETMIFSTVEDEIFSQHSPEEIYNNFYENLLGRCPTEDEANAEIPQVLPGGAYKSLVKLVVDTKFTAANFERLRSGPAITHECHVSPSLIQ